MYKTFMTGLSLGLFVLTPATLNASSAVFDGIPTVLSYGDSLTSPVSAEASGSISDAVTSLNLFRTYSKLSDMSLEERKNLAKRLGSSKRIELERTIPEAQKDAVAKEESFCFLFWRGCFRVSSKTLGGLAIDIILDLSDGKLDGQGPRGSIDYIHHLAEIINATIEEIRSEKNKG